MAKFLIKALSKEDAGKKDRWGRTAADDAASYLMRDDATEGMKKVVALLADKGINPTGATGKAGGANSVGSTGATGKVGGASSVGIGF